MLPTSAAHRRLPSGPDVAGWRVGFSLGLAMLFFRHWSMFLFYRQIKGNEKKVTDLQTAAYRVALRLRTDLTSFFQIPLRSYTHMLPPVVSGYERDFGVAM